VETAFAFHDLTLASKEQTGPLRRHASACGAS